MLAPVFKGKTKDDLSYVIRLPKPSDAPQLVDYINTLSQERTFIGFQGETLTLKDERAFIKKQRDLYKNGDGVCLILVVDGKIAGVCECNRKRISIESHIGMIGMSIAKPFRDQGLGRLLFETLLLESKKHLKKLRFFSLLVFGNNPRAQHLYTSCGFQEFGRFPQGLKHRGKYVDQVYMYRPV